MSQFMNGSKKTASICIRTGTTSFCSEKAIAIRFAEILTCIAIFVQYN